MSGPNTPGIFGYVVALAASWLICAALVVLPGAVATGNALVALGVLLMYSPFVAVACAVYGLPVAMAGVVLVQLVCSRVEHQGVHALASGLAGAGLSAAYFGLAPAPDVWGPWLPVPVGLAAAVGRLVVIPLVTSRRRLAAQGTLTGTARW